MLEIRTTLILIAWAIELDRWKYARCPESCWTAIQWNQIYVPTLHEVPQSDDLDTAPQIKGGYVLQTNAKATPCTYPILNTITTTNFRAATAYALGTEITAAAGTQAALQETLVKHMKFTHSK